MRHQSSENRKKDRIQHPPGEPSVFTCPDCSGTLFVVRDGTLIRFRCRVGHAYSPEAMLEAQDDNVERLMWSASRALEEQAEYLQTMAREIAKSGDGEMERWYARKNRIALHSSRIIRKLLTGGTDDGQYKGVRKAPR